MVLIFFQKGTTKQKEISLWSIGTKHNQSIGTKHNQSIGTKYNQSKQIL